MPKLVPVPDPDLPDSSSPDPLPNAADAPRLSLHGVGTLQDRAAAPARLERKQAALLAWLALNGATPRPRLAGLLWPEATAAGARGNLRQCIARLRKLAPSLLIDDGELLSLSPTVTVAPREPGGPALLEAHDYADCDELARWLEARTESDRTAERAALMTEVREAMQGGRLDRAQARADALLALDRESEDAYRALMEVAYLRGDFSSAVAVWDRCRQMLRTLYGVAPSTATQALGAAVLAASRSAGRAGPAPPSTPVPALPASFLRPPQLIGRGEALRSMGLAWRAGQMVCVTGEAGIGKSRLLAEFAASLGAGVSLAARPGDAVRPYATLTRLVSIAIDRFRPPLGTASARWAARVLPGIAYLVADASPTPPQTAHELQRALQGLREVLAECTRLGCTSFVLDDLQFADLATIEALPALVDVPRSEVTAVEPGPRFAFGSRLDDPAAPSARLLAAYAVSRDVYAVALGPLAGAEVAALVACLSLPPERTRAISPRLYAQVGGNPAFVIESLKLALSLDDLAAERGPDREAIPVPPGIEPVIQRRIALLGARARHIAQLAAVAGALFSVEMAASALACAVPELDEPLLELERRQVLSGRHFAHDLVEAAMVRSIPASVAEFMQRFVAGHLEVRDADPAIVAGHWRAGGEQRRAGEAYVAAAAAARSSMRPRETAGFLDSAIECLERADDRDALFNAIEERLQVIEAMDRNVVRPALNIRLGELAQSEEQQLRVLLYRHAFLSQHHAQGALVSLERGVARARALSLPRLAFDFAEPTAHLLASSGRSAEARALLESFAPWVESTSDVRLQGRLARTLGVVCAYGERLAESIAHGERAIALFASIGDDLRALPSMANVGLALHWRGELVAAQAVLERAVGLRDRLHGDASGGLLDVNLAAVQRDLGQFAIAEPRLREALSRMHAGRAANADEPATDIVLLENHLAQLWLMLGRPQCALDEMQTDDAGIEARFRSRRVSLRLRATRSLGRDTGALEAAAVALIADLASPIHLAMLEFETLCCALPRAALDGYARWHEEPCVVERPGLRMQASLRAAEAALALGELTEADRWLGLAAPVLARLPPFDLDVDSAWRIAEVVYAASGDLDRAAEAAGHAKRVVAEVASRLPEAWRADYLASRREAKTFSAPPRDRRPSRAATARRRASRAVRSRPAQ